MAATSFFIRELERHVKIGGWRDIVEFSTSGDNTIIAAIPNRIIKIHKLFIVGRAASDIQFWSGPSSENNPLSGLLPFASPFGLAVDGDEFPTHTLPGKAFVISSSNVIDCGGWVVYTLD